MNSPHPLIKTYQDLNEGKQHTYRRIVKNQLRTSTTDYILTNSKLNYKLKQEFNDYSDHSVIVAKIDIPNKSERLKPLKIPSKK